MNMKLDDVCYAEFLYNYSLDNVRSKYVKDSQTQILSKLELEFLEGINLPKRILLMPLK